MNIALRLAYRLALIALILGITGCERTEVQRGNQVEETAILVKAVHEPAKIELTVGYHLGFKGKMVFGPYTRHIPEQNLAKLRFGWGTTETTDPAICTYLSGLKVGTRVSVCYYPLTLVTYKKDVVVNKQSYGNEFTWVMALAEAE